jgi:lysophospholipase L1-like esterase
MKKTFFSLLIIFSLFVSKSALSQTFYNASNSFFQYMGRGDFRNINHPTFWAPGAQIIFSFEGNSCIIDLTDENLYNKNLNYIQLIVDGKYSRFKLKEKESKISLKGLKDSIHSVIICKTTESNIGYLQFNGVTCNVLVSPPALPERKIECFGNSITCGTGSDMEEIPCGKGEWQDQHNAYLSYGEQTARALNAQVHLTSASGIGLMHSCCDMKVIMPQIYDKINLRDNLIQWDFSTYQPDVVTICLGQNDGVQDNKTFCDNYLQFIHSLRKVYPVAHIVLLTSPMADEKLTLNMKSNLIIIAKESNENGDRKVSTFFFSRSYNSGCDNHPSLAEHQLIAAELTAYLKRLMNW